MAGAELVIPAAPSGRKSKLAYGSSGLVWKPELIDHLRSQRTDLGSVLAPATVTPSYTLGPAGTPGSQIASSALVSRPLAADNSDTGVPYTYLGGYNLAFGASGVDVNQVRPTQFAGSIVLGPYSVRFGFAGDTKFEIRLKAITNLSFRLRIDDRLVTESEQVVGGTAGTIYGLLVSGLDPGHHVYQFDFPGIMWFGGIYAVPTTGVWRGARPTVKAVLLSDSTGAGANGNGPGGAFGSAVWWQRFCHLHGWEGFNASQGGTGMIASSFPYLSRVASDVTAKTPDVIIVSGSRNDNGSGLSAVQAAATTLYQTSVDANPQALVIAIGPWFSTSSPAQGYIDANSGTRAAALAVGIPFIDMWTGDVVMGNGSIVATGSKWITGTGFSGSTNGSGNADVYIGSDDVHPTLSGHSYFAQRAYVATRTVINNL